MYGGRPQTTKPRFFNSAGHFFSKASVSKKNLALLWVKMNLKGLGNHQKKLGPPTPLLFKHLIETDPF